MRTHNVLITKSSELGEFLSHQQLGHPDHSEDRVPRVLRDFRSRVQLEVWTWLKYFGSSVKSDEWNFQIQIAIKYYKKKIAIKCYKKKIAIGAI